MGGRGVNFVHVMLEEKAEPARTKNKTRKETRAGSRAGEGLAASHCRGPSSPPPWLGRGTTSPSIAVAFGCQACML